MANDGRHLPSLWEYRCSNTRRLLNSCGVARIRQESVADGRFRATVKWGIDRLLRGYDAGLRSLYLTWWCATSAANQLPQRYTCY